MPSGGDAHSSDGPAWLTGGSLGRGAAQGGFTKKGDEASPTSPVLAAFPSMARPRQVKPGRRQAAAQAVQAGAQQGRWE